MGKRKGIKTERGVYAVLCLITVCLFIYRLMQGFRWPSDYVLTCHIVSYRFGWLPRSLIGTIGTLIFGEKWYMRRYINIFILGAAFIFIIWFLAASIIYTIKERSFIGMAVFLSFAFSPYAKYYLHEMGYYEQYGYAVCVLLIFMMPGISIKRSILFSAIAGFFALLISESNMFLVVPVLFAMAFISIVNDEEGTAAMRKDIGLLLLLHIPHIVYCLLIWFVKVPQELVDRLSAYDKSHVVDFTFRDDVHGYFCNRSDPNVWPRMLHEIPVWCVAYPMLLVCFAGSVILCEKQIKLLLSYLLCTGMAGICAYAISILAWDLDRFYFCIFMSVFMITVFVLRKYLYTVRLKKEYACLTLMLVLALVPISKNEFGLFDGAQYNGSIQDFYEMVMSIF